MFHVTISVNGILPIPVYPTSMKHGISYMFVLTENIYEISCIHYCFLDILV